MQVKVSDKKTIIIKDTEIKNLMNNLQIDKKEAVELWLCDNGYTTNEQVEILTKKAKTNKTDKIIASDKTKRQKTERKPTQNPLKEQIIAYILQNIGNFDGISNIKLTNKTKSIDFYVNNKYFTLNLVEHRQKK